MLKQPACSLLQSAGWREENLHVQDLTALQRTVCEKVNLSFAKILVSHSDGELETFPVKSILFLAGDSKIFS